MPFDRNSPLPDAGTVGISDYDTPVPSFQETLNAAFRQENLIGSSLSNARLGMDQRQLYTVDPNYNPLDDIKGYEDHAERFTEIYNKPAADALKANIDKETKDRATLAASGWTGVGLQVVAGVLDPTILIPGGALGRAGKVGYSTARSALSIGAAAAIGTAAQETGLQATQELRTGEDSAMAIGGSAILGGLIGAGASKFFNGVEWTRVSKQLEADLADESPNPAQLTDTIVKRMQSAGASAVDDIKLDDLGIGGPKAAQLIARATSAARINPGIQTMFSPSSKVREAYTKMVDNPVYNQMNMEGRSLGADVENLVKQYERGAVANWISGSRKLYRDARKSGYTGTLSEFNQAVAKAGRRGDVDMDGNEFITQAARDARAKIFDPLLERAKSLDLLPEDVKTTTATSYVTRLWSRQHLIGEEERFREIARKHFSGELDRQVFKQEERKLGNKVVDSMFVEDRFDKAFARLSSVEDRLNKRSTVREGKLGRVKAEESRRFDVLKGRAPKQVVDALREGKSDDTLVSFVKESRKAENVKRAKTPVLSILKKRGGVRIGSGLDANLRSIGVTPKTVPGLFRSDGGRGAADNIIAREHDVFDNIGTDDNGYVLENDLLEAIRGEVSGSPLRSASDETEMANADAMAANVENWLETAGISPNATIKEIRDHMNQVLGQERALDDVDMRISRMNNEIEEFDKATDAVKNEKVISEAEAANIAKELQTLEDEINANADLARSSPAIARMVDYAKARREFGSARYEQGRVKARLDALKRVDADGRLTPELDAEMRALSQTAKEVEERIAKAQATSDKLKPMLPKQKEDIPEFIGAEDRNDYIEQVVTSVFNNLTGKGAGDVPEWLIPVTRGPLKDRTFNIQDELVEDFLENDMELVLRRYARTMAAEVELTQKFGRADMKDQFEEITNEYADLRKGAKTLAEKEKLNADEARDVQNLSAFRDMIRGTYRAAEEGSAWSKITRAALTWNYIRLLGGMTLSSLSDTTRLLGVHGMRATVREAVPSLVSGLKAAKISRSDARDLGAVTERVLQSRLASLADLQDPYRYGSKYERFLSNASNVFTKATGLGWWNDTMKMMASVMTQNRMMRNALDYGAADAREKAYMAFLGIDEDMASRIAGQFKKYGMQEDGIYGANVSHWDDDLAQRTWAAALNKDVDRTIITKGVADTPLWMKTNWGKLIMQFKSFGLASHQRVLIAGLQERPHRLAEQLVFGTSIGMMIAYLKYAERGDLDETQKLIDNPGKWVADGLDRTGILSLPFDITNTVDKVSQGVGGPNVGISGAVSTIAGDKDSSGSTSRYASRGAVGAVLGPSVGIFEDLATIAAQLSKGDLKKSGANAIIRQIPGATLPGIRTAIHAGIKPALHEAVD